MESPEPAVSAFTLVLRRSTRTIVQHVHSSFPAAHRYTVVLNWKHPSAPSHQLIRSPGASSTRLDPEAKCEASRWPRGLSSCRPGSGSCRRPCSIGFSARSNPVITAVAEVLSQPGWRTAWDTFSRAALMTNSPEHSVYADPSPLPMHSTSNPASLGREVPTSLTWPWPIATIASSWSSVELGG